MPHPLTQTPHHNHSETLVNLWGRGAPTPRGPVRHLEEPALFRRFPPHEILGAL